MPSPAYMGYGVGDCNLLILLIETVCSRFIDLCVHFKTRFLFGPAFCRTNIYKGIKLVLELFRGLFFAHIVATTLKHNSVCVKN